MRFEEKVGHTNLNNETVYLLFMDLSQNDWKNILRNKTSQKSLFKSFCYNNQGTRKIKNFQKFSIRKSSSAFNLIILNTSNPLTLLHGQILWKDTIISVLILGAKSLLIGSLLTKSLLLLQSCFLYQ